jgi:hypothetical protein
MYIFGKKGSKEPTEQKLISVGWRAMQGGGLLEL